MKKIWIPVFVAAIACFAGTAAAEIGSLGSRDVSLAVCFTLEEIGQCGQGAIGETITCSDGSSGPGWIITAEKTYKCMDCPQGLSGQKRCTNTGGPAEQELQSYGCPGGSWGAAGDPITLQTCHTGELSGNECEG
jgi:hypothetical protein